MTGRAAGTALALAFAMTPVAVPGVTQALHAQRWSADVYAGGTREAALSGRTGNVNLIGNIRYASVPTSFLYLSVAGPVSGGAVPWVAGGAGRRVATPGPVSVGVGVAGHGYGFRGTEGGVDGAGVTLHALPDLVWTNGDLAFDMRVGRHEHRYRFGEEDGTRGVFEAGAGARLLRGPLAARLDARWLRDDTASFPFAGVQLAAAAERVRVRASIGRWLIRGDGRAEWSLDATLSAGSFGDVWGGYRSQARDPLYLSPARTSWNVGLSRSFGRRPATTTLPAPHPRAGGVVFRLPARAVPDPAEPPAVAGEFSDWEPVPMTRAGGEWTLYVALPSGVHRFAFVADGEWFVPEGYPGRIDDGMGGWVAVVVVP